MSKIRVGIIGATGYLGQELIRILRKHQYAEISYLAYSRKFQEKISQIIPAFDKLVDLECKQFNIQGSVASADILFLALPAEESTKITDRLLKAGKRVIDLSAAFRLKKNVVYGLPEVYRTEIAKTNFIANPGCYPTSVILGCAPLLKQRLIRDSFIIADAKSGLTGAGKRLETYLLFSEADENITPYKVNEHRHMLEMSHHLSNLSDRKMGIVFVPQIVPMKRGILSAVYLKLVKGISENRLIKIYRDFYKDEPFVRVKEKGIFPQTSEVSGTNFCDIGIRVDATHSLAIVLSCIDNLMKGGAGQAVQNMNIMYGFKETEGLL